MKSLNCKVSMVTSPKGGEGKSTISSYLAVKLAKEGYITGLIEFDRYFSSVPYILGIEDMMERSLEGAIKTQSDKEIMSNFVPHPEIKDLYILSLNIHKAKRINCLQRFPEEQIKNIIKIARAKFGAVILDCPSCYIEQAFLAPLSLGVDRLIYVIDNDIAKLAGLKLYDMFFKETALSFNDVITVINKDCGLINEQVIKTVNKELSVIKFKNVFNIPFYKRIVEFKNNGVILTGIPSNREEKKFGKAINEMFRHIEKFEADNLRNYQEESAV